MRTSLPRPSHSFFIILIRPNPHTPTNSSRAASYLFVHDSLIVVVTVFHKRGGAGRKEYKNKKKVVGSGVGMNIRAPMGVLAS